MGFSHERAALRIPESTWAVIRACFSMTPKLVWFGLCILSLVLYGIAQLGAESNFKPLAAPGGLIGAIWFALLGSNLNVMSKSMNQSLTPDYPGNYIAAAYTMLGSYVTVTALLMAAVNIDWIVPTVVATVFFASASLFVTNHNWWIHTIFLILMFSFLIFIEDGVDLWNQIDASTYLLMLLLMLLLSGLALGYWQQGLLAVKVQRESMTPFTGKSHATVDNRVAQVNRRFNTGYLGSPAFMRVSRLSQRPNWWWLRFGLSDPWRTSANIYTFIIMTVFWVSMEPEFLQTGMGIFLIVLANIISQESLGQQGTRRLYLQMPALSKSRFLMEIGKLHCLKGIAVMLVFSIVLAVSGAVVASGGMAFEILALCAIAYALSSIGFISISMYVPGIDLAMLRWRFVSVFFGFPAVVCLLLDVLEVVILDHRILAVTALALYALMYQRFRAWSRADIDL